MPDFVHGVETFHVESGGVVVRGVKSSVIGLVGTAPVHHCAVQYINLDEQCVGEVDDLKKFGPNVAGYTIPQALEVLRKEGAKWVVVVNVFNPTTHKTTVAAADRAITNKLLQLPHGDIISVTVKAAGGAGSTLLEGTDYTIDKVKGLITILTGGALAAAANANVAYDRGNPAAVVAADVIGTVDGAGARTGLLRLKDSQSRRGYGPKIVHAPVFSTQASVVAQMRTVIAGNQLRAVAFCDAPIGTTVEEAIEGRGPAGTINFNVSDRRLLLCAPHVYVYDRATDSNVLTPMSNVGVGIMADTDTRRGYWKSPSNENSKAIMGLEIPISASLNDPTAETNQLNGAGICTILNMYGTGYRFWGNRSSAWPSDATEKSFVSQQRISDFIDDSIEQAMLPVMDEPVSAVIITDILQAANNFLREQVRRGALAPGSRVVFPAEANPADNVSKGKLLFQTIEVGAPPLENVIFEHRVDRSLLSNLLPVAS
jgi:phage tail sheath protein FI